MFFFQFFYNNHYTIASGLYGNSYNLHGEDFQRHFIDNIIRLLYYHYYRYIMYLSLVWTQRRTSWVVNVAW